VQPGDSRSDLANLAWTIAHCPHFLGYDAGKAGVCSDVIKAQGEWRRSPEGWTGRLLEAPILFVTSNPNTDVTKPGTDPVFRSAEELAAFNDLYFDSHVIGGVQTWKQMERWATTLLGGEAAAPGKDFALTDAVRCASPLQNGVDRAMGPLCRPLSGLDARFGRREGCGVLWKGTRCPTGVCRAYALPHVSCCRGRYRPSGILRARKNANWAQASRRYLSRQPRAYRPKFNGPRETGRILGDELALSRVSTPPMLLIRDSYHAQSSRPPRRDRRPGDRNRGLRDSSEVCSSRVASPSAAGLCCWRD
jgi:hypothetical protein